MLAEFNLPDPSELVVIDSGLVVALAVDHESLHSQAVFLFEQFRRQGTQFIAPSLFDYEVASIFSLKLFRWQVRSKNSSEFTEEEANDARELISFLDVRLEHSPGLIDSAYEIARQFGQARIYDSSYAALAQTLGVPLWTADHNFYVSVNGPAVPASKRLSFVHYLGALPIDSARD